MNLIAYHLVRLDISSQIPLKILEELFRRLGVTESFGIYRLVDSEDGFTTVFDYPVEWNKEQCIEFMEKANPRLRRLNQMFSEKGIRDLATKIATT